MPAVVVGHEMRMAPVRAGGGKKGQALLVAVRGLHHMGQSMGRPGVARVQGKRLAAEVLGAPEVSGLLEPERVGAEDKAGERIVPAPGRQDPGDRIAHWRRPAEKEIGVLRQAQGERVGRVIGKDALPALDRLRELALRPGLRRREMAPLALRGGRNRRFGRTQRALDLRMIAAKAADHVEGRDRDAGQRKIGVAGQRGFEDADRIAGQPIIVGDRAIERRGRLGRAGERQALLVFGHVSILRPPITRAAFWRYPWARASSQTCDQASPSCARERD